MAFSFAYTIPVLGAQSFAAALLSPDRQTWGNVAWLRMTRGWLDHIETECAFATKFVDGTLFLTADMPGVFDLPPGWGGRIFPGARPRHLFAHHQEELAARQNARPVSLDQDGLKQLVTDVRVRVAEFMIGRGVWAPLTEEEVKCIRRESMPDE